MLRRSLFLAPLLLAATRARAAAPLRVVASFSILADLVRQVGGERVTVRALVGPDADAHSFSPRPSDVAALREAQLVVRNGLGFEPWLDRLLAAAGGKVTTVVASTGITPRRMEGGHDHGHGHSHGKPGETVADPHAWQDLTNGQAYVRTIAAGLTAADPEGASLYAANAEALVGRLAALDGWVRQQVASVPQARRKVVTSHDAFGYFAAAYGVEFRAPQGVSTEGEPSARAVAALARQLKAEGITAVFIENMTNPALLDRLAAEANVRVRGRLFSDALSAEGGPAPTYEAMVRHNVGLLVPAMKGEGG
ncbi:metal ABC transporter substrate-binding protein [Pseudoroseomonas deserti]|uniref:Metal ABC transporter substrate-binding protein n=1 Tax=Teichococcus deserti TaxID=1817963 RepID=A0A1V2GWH7_9PROT|nr:zinc ABC transporter substrate-binding protein [Pseudoroseomonas deserti]ONG45128.1 metal ABC transporter substrate-binding protein [Pseudoroseomonas deserti]